MAATGPSTTVDRTDPTVATPDPDAPPADEEGRGDVPEDFPEEAPASVPSAMVTVTDPVNGAFSAQVPEGWDTVAYSNVEGQVVRSVITTVSPDGGTVLFAGDPKIPSYWNPDAADEMTVRFAEMLDSMELAYYVPADEYGVNYVTEKFGELDGFTMGAVERDTAREQQLMSQYQSAGVGPTDLRIALVRFSFVDGEGSPSNGGVTVFTADLGHVWQVQVYGAATNGDLDTFVEAAGSMMQSIQPQADFQATLQQRHQDTMALIERRTEEMTRRHEANMQWIQDSANAHQQRMQAIWASNDAQIASYYDRMASMDVGHREFLNYVNDERTVQSSSGTKHQVDDGYQRYWMNPATGEYAGGDVNFDETQLRELGLDPSAFEEVQIVRG